MDNLAEIIEQADSFVMDFEDWEACEVVEISSDYKRRDSLSETFNDEIEAWARHALASNGFGDY
jgi:hypothetical protein